MRAEVDIDILQSCIESVIVKITMAEFLYQVCVVSQTGIGVYAL